MIELKHTYKKGGYIKQVISFCTKTNTKVNEKQNYVSYD